jgi:hypothetical protein
MVRCKHELEIEGTAGEGVRWDENNRAMMFRVLIGPRCEGSGRGAASRCGVGWWGAKGGGGEDRPGYGSGTRMILVRLQLVSRGTAAVFRRRFPVS